jgi:ABC-type transport system involved in multi-copper enzyme maturation permease subunit
MTALIDAPGRVSVPFSPKAGFAALLLSEWTKIRSLRSTVWSLVLLVVMNIGFTALFTALTMSQWSKSDASEHARLVGDPTSAILASGLELSQLAICVLGVLVIASEYSSGTIRVSLLAVPRRTPMLAAKALVFGALVFVVGVVAAFPSFYLGAAIMHGHAPVSLSDPGVLRAVIGAGLYLSVLGVFAIAIGSIVRHTAGGITGIIAFVLVLVPLAQLLPGTTGKYVFAYLPSSAGTLITFPRQGADQLLSPWQGFGVFSAWTAVLLIAAGYLLKRRDA